jgi:hypothetical protein
MEQAIARTMTDLTCWKCGEESLKESAGTDAARGPRADQVAAVDLHHSECQKCGTYSVNAAQAAYNKMVGRKARKARIYESNRSSK